MTASLTTQDEVNIAHNEPSLLRSTEVRRLALLGLVDGRKASTELSDFDAEAVRQRIAGLYADASSAPQDAANAVSSGQRARIVQGPQQGDLGLLADKAAELLAFRARETPRMMLDEGAALHTRADSRTLTTGDSDLSCCLGWYALSVFGTARDGAQSSSFNYTGGAANDLRERPAVEYFAIDEMLRDTERQIRTEPIGANFVGDVVLMPNAVANLVELAARADRRRPADRRQLALPRPRRRARRVAAAQPAEPLRRARRRRALRRRVRDAAGRDRPRGPADGARAQPLRQPQDRVCRTCRPHRPAGISQPAPRRATSCSAASRAARWSGASRWGARPRTATSPA